MGHVGTWFSRPAKQLDAADLEATVSGKVGAMQSKRKQLSKF